MAYTRKSQQIDGVQRLPIDIGIGILAGVDAERIGFDVATETGVVVAQTVLVEPAGLVLGPLVRRAEVKPTASRF